MSETHKFAFVSGCCCLFEAGNLAEPQKNHAEGGMVKVMWETGWHTYQVTTTTNMAPNMGQDLIACVLS